MVQPTARPQARTARTAREAPGTRSRRCSPSWARLISKVYHADPHLPRMWGSAQDHRYLHDRTAIDKILDHLGLSPPESQRPPPEVCYVAVDGEGRELDVTARVAEGH